MLGKTYRGIRESQRRISLPPSAKNEAMAEPCRPFKLGVFVGLADDPPRSPASRSPRGFGNGAVGLGIVAAMSAGEGLGAAARTEPIPIVSAAAAARPRGRPPPAEEELSESYTCVISHLGGNAVRKRVYLNDGTELNVNDGNCERAMGVFFNSPPVAPPRLGPPPLPEDFLSRCYLCRKNLNGLDIFMYRGEKAFCSVECRCQQILSDEVWEKCGSEALKQYDCSVSPRSTPLLFTAGLAAA